MVVVLRSRIGISVVSALLAVPSVAQIALPPIPIQLIGPTDSTAKSRTSTKPDASSNRRPSRTVSEPPKSISAWMSNNVFRRIDVSGNRSLGFHSHQISGDRDAFNTLNYYGNGGATVTNTGNMTLAGKKVLGLLDFQYQFTDDRIQSPDSNRMTLNYDQGPVKMSYGDIRASLLNTNPFASFNRSLYGLTTQYKYGRTQFSAVRSDVKGVARTVSLVGNNTAGPYYLQAGRLIADSVEVRLDGQVMRLMQDYVVDSDQGSITFVNRIILPTSSIVASYEASSFNQSTGTVQGAGFAYDFGRVGRLGFTQIEQRGTGNGTNRSLLETFQGYGDPSTPYTLSYEPILGTAIVRVRGSVQIEGADYRFDTQIPSRFFFLRYIPNTDTVSVTYRPKLVQALNGDRRVMGFDYRIPFGKEGRLGYVQYSTARGELLSRDAPRSGTSRGVSAAYESGGLRLTTDIRDIPAEYVSVQSQGFGRNERATTVGAELTRGKWLYGASNSNSLVSSQNTSLSAITYTNSRITNTREFATYTDPNGGNFTLENIQSFSRNSYENRLNTTSISSHRSFGKLDASVGFDVQNGAGPQTVSDQIRHGNLNLRTYRLTGRYTPDDHLALDTRLSLSQISSLTGSGRGSDVSVNATYKPSAAWTLSGGYTVSDSGQVASFGAFTPGGGIGYGGNGFSSGSAGDALSGGASTLRLLQFNTGYRASDRMNLTARYYQAQNQGDLSSNTKSRAYGFGADWDLGRQTLIGGAIDRSVTNYLGSSLGYGSETTTYDLYFQGAPKGSWSFRLGVNGLISAGGAPNRQNSLNTDTALIFRITPKQRAWLSYSTGQSTGYYGQSSGYFGAFYEYQLYHGVSLLGSFKSRKVINLDPLVQTGSYRSTGFDLELSFGFAP